MAESASQGIVNIKMELRRATMEAQRLGLELANAKDNADMDPNKIREMSDALNEATNKAAGLKDQINDTNERINVLAGGSKFEIAANGLGDMSSKLASLDFEGARESSERMVSTIKSINPADATKALNDIKGTFINMASAGVAGFKGVINVVGMMSKAFIQFGISLLANPIFLLVAAIVAIVVAIVMFLNKIGVLKKVMEALGAVFDFIVGVIDAIVQGFKDLTDWLGFSNNAAEDAAQRQADAAEKTAKAYEKKSAGVVAGYDHEIKMAELSGESTREAELKKAYYILNTAKARAKADIAAYQSAKLAGDLDEEELAALKDKMDASVLGAKESGYAIEELNAKFRKEDKDARTKKAEDDAKIEDDKNKKIEDANKKAAEDAKKRREEENKARIAADKMIIDITLENMEEGVDKELAINAEKYKRLRDDNLNNALITAKQRNAIDALLLEQKTAEENKILEDDRKNKLDADRAFNDELLALRQGINMTESESLKAAYDSDLENLKRRFADKLITEEQYLQLSGALKSKYGEEQAAIDKDIADREAVAKAELGATDLEGKLAQMELERQMELENTELTASEKELINQKYDQMRLDAIEKERQEKLKALSADIDIAKQGLAAAQGLSDAVFAVKKRNLVKGSAEELKMAKQQFKINKALQIGGAIMDGAKAVISSLAQSPIAIGPVPNPAGIASLAFVGITAAANIAKIAATKFEGGGGGGGSAPTPPSISAGEAATPSMNLFGSGNEGNNATAAKSVEGQNNININATVSVSEISEVQDRVKVIEDRGTL